MLEFTVMISRSTRIRHLGKSRECWVFILNLCVNQRQQRSKYIGDKLMGNFQPTQLAEFLLIVYRNKFKNLLLHIYAFNFSSKVVRLVLPSNVDSLELHHQNKLP